MRETKEQSMESFKHITLSELQALIKDLQLSPETRLSVQFDNTEAVQKALKKQKSIAAMKKLRGSGNGRLMNALLADRAKERAR